MPTSNKPVGFGTHRMHANAPDAFSNPLPIRRGRGRSVRPRRRSPQHAPRRAEPAPRASRQEVDIMLSKILSSAALLGASLWSSSAWPVDPPGSKPGDDALTCEQIYAQGAAESQREQQEHAAKAEEMKRQTNGLRGLVIGAAMTGGMGGTAQAAQ